MSQYGFAIDQRKCIGCHACTVACKMENDVPLGVFRTWVKYIEKGTFPDARRYFSVLRCNHCTDAPCVEICPTKALYKRTDGIVDFDGDSCIGCKACMQACPYDALYIDPTTLTAAKCNFCAHRVEVDLAPACEIVCPTHAIISGDIDDPGTEIYQILRREQVSVRAPEQGTGPNVFYIGADECALTPDAVRQADAYLWSEIVPDAQSVSRGGEILAMAAEARTTYNVAHPPMWGWRVSTYLWTKSIGAGIPLVALLARVRGTGSSGLSGPMAPVLGFALIAITGYLLVSDLKQPLRFLYIFLKPNWSSWLVWGAWILAAYCGALIGWFWADVGGPPAFGMIGRIAAVPLALMAAAYSGWLFNQAEGRDLWQSRLLHAHLVVLAALCGSAAMLVGAPLVHVSPAVFALLRVVVISSAGAHLLILLLEYTGRHATKSASIASRNLTGGRFAGSFRLSVGAVVLGAGLAIVAPVAPAASILAGALVLFGTWRYEDVWVKAGQSAPLS